MFDHLVTPSGTKIAHRVGDLARYAAARRGASSCRCSTKLGDERILRSVAADGEHDSRYEIFHDTLAEPVLAWKAEHEAQRELDRERAESERRHRRLLRLLAGAAVALLVMAGVTVFALTQRSEARSQARLARARELAATAVSQLLVDPQLSLRLGIESADLKRTTQAEDVLRQALISSKERAILPSKGLCEASRSAATARCWRRRATTGRPGSGGRTGHPLHTLRHRGPVVSAVFSPDGSQVLTASADGTARIWRAGDGGPIATLRHRGPVTSAAVQP